MIDKDKIKALREIVPIPISEALKILKENDGDVEKCVYLFKNQCIIDISKVTGCDIKMATKYYEKEKLDVNRAISSIKERLFDISYKPIKGLDFDTLRYVADWLYVMNSKDFITSLDFNRIDSVINTLKLIPELTECGETLFKAKKIKDSYFIGYSDSDPISEFINRHSMLDADNEFQKVCRYFELKPIVIKEIIDRYGRNMKK